MPSSRTRLWGFLTATQRRGESWASLYSGLLWGVGVKPYSRISATLLSSPEMCLPLCFMGYHAPHCLPIKEDGAQGGLGSEAREGGRLIVRGTALSAEWPNVLPETLDLVLPLSWALGQTDQTGSIKWNRAPGNSLDVLVPARYEHFSAGSSGSVKEGKGRAWSRMEL